MISATFNPHPALFWYYLFVGMALLSMTGVMWLSWRIRHDNLAGLLSMLFLWLALDTLAKGILRSTQAIVSHEQILYVSRVASFGIVTTAALIVDAYLASRNGHLSGLRRIVLWYRGKRDPAPDQDLLLRMEDLRHDVLVGHNGYDPEGLVAIQDGLDQLGGVSARSHRLHSQRCADWRSATRPGR